MEILILKTLREFYDIIKKSKRKEAFLKNETMQECDENGDTLLTYAVCDENLEMVNFLLKKSFSPMMENQYGVTPLILSAQIDCVSVLEALFTFCASNLSQEDIACLYANAAYYGCTKNIQYLIKHYPVKDIMFQGDSILHWSINSGNVETVKLVFSIISNLNVQNEDGMTPIYNACAEGELAIAKLLLSKNADINIPSYSGCTPLGIAICYGHTEIVALLLKYHANLETRDLEGMTPLLYSIKYNKIDIFELLLKNGAKIDVVDNNLHGFRFYADYKHINNYISLMVKYGYKPDDVK